MITVVARVIRDEFSGKEGAKVWSVKSINHTRRLSHATNVGGGKGWT